MARRWTPEEEKYYRDQLIELYVAQNMTIGEAGVFLGISEKTVYDRLCRLNIPLCPERKARYCNTTRRVRVPTERSEMLAEFFGIMLGDGHVSHFQAMVTLGTEELEYVEYVADLMEHLFNVRGTINVRKDGYRTVYLGSVRLTQWLISEGLVENKVAKQVDVPPWIFSTSEWMRAFIRGFFDTDGSVYRLKFGRQISLTNCSLPILHSLRTMLITLQYHPSAVGSYKVYLTRRNDIVRFFSEIRPKNTKHLRRYAEFPT